MIAERENNLFIVTLLTSGLGIIFLSALSGNIPLVAIVALLPFIILTTYYFLRYPIILFFIYFTFNYYIIGIARYISIPYMSVLINVIFYSIFIVCFIHAILLKSYERKYLFNFLSISSLFWLFYCILQLANPTSVLLAWIASRDTMLGMFTINIIVSLLFDRYKYVKIIIFLYAIFSFSADLVCFKQKIFGFDWAENQWLEAGNKITHILNYGIRYFSFFSDGNNFGCSIAVSAVTFFILAIYYKNKSLKVFYFIVSICSFISMFLSGTRGAMAVPFAAMFAYIVLVKNIRLAILGTTVLLLVYFILAFTTIGSSNTQVRRMRSVFKFEKDPSMLVRQNNNMRLSQYLKSKPFGEGLGLSGLENQKYAMRLTTAITTNSWYVKIWVETGIVGLIIYLIVVLGSMANATWIIMFKLKDSELKGICISFICGISGLLASSYAATNFGQFPNYLITFAFLSIVLKAEYFDQEIKESIIDKRKKITNL